MAQEAGRIRFHYGFYAAMKLEYDIIHAPVTYEQEIQLGEDPVRLDFLIIKKDAGVVLNDPIGEFFRAVNLFEYKSPEDGLSIDDFYKALGYGLIYKGYDRKVNELPIEDMTLTIVRHSYPRELINTLKQSGFTVDKKYPGIYRIDGKISIKTQIVVSSRLLNGEYEGLKLLASGCTKEAVISYARKAIASEDENVKTNAETVIGICLDINNSLGKQLEEDEAMNEVISRIIKRNIDAARLEGINEGINKGINKGINEDKERVAADMLRDGKPLEEITRYSKLAEDTIRNLAKTLGVAIM
ncbi:MAG: hypothetical protein II917_01160 [Synergistaceae bacterium]|nr:hypothetical protein [Synergistaceae bacterium]